DSYLDFRFGFFKSSIKNSKIAIRLFDEILEPKEKELLGGTGIECLCLNALVNCILGEFQKTLDNRRLIVSIMKTISYKGAFHDGLANIVKINLWLKEFKKIEPPLNKLLEIESEDFLKFSNVRAFEALIRGTILSHQQDYNNAIAKVSNAIQFFNSKGNISGRDLDYLALTDMYQKNGSLINAKRTLAKAVDNQKKTGERVYCARVARIHGNILRAEGKFYQAEEKYLEAIQIAREQSAKLFELYAVEDLCTLWHQQGKTEQAYARLSEMLAQFDGQPEVGILREAKALLETFQVKPIAQ
ncbi:MAG: hypothetical protein V2J07_01030, partial [Anaerolineae bacterium]|nr:hypothetical protein [Anaerolineae bacterium]